MDTQENLRQFLAAFGVHEPGEMTQVREGVWSIGEAYILKTVTDEGQTARSARICERLLPMGLPVPEYVRTSSGALLGTGADGTRRALIRKRPGRHIEPLDGDAAANGWMFGGIIAALHAALACIGGDLDGYVSDAYAELDGWILGELRGKRLQVSPSIVASIRAEAYLYRKLPRQLIHRDMHPGNLLFDGGRFSGYLDFDISQNNVRAFDLCYFGAATLVDKYRDPDALAAWRRMFAGLLAGYDRALPLTMAERAAMPMLFLLIELTFAAFFSRLGQEDTARKCLEMAEWLFGDWGELARICERSFGIGGFPLEEGVWFPREKGGFPPQDGGNGA